MGSDNNDVPSGIAMVPPRRVLREQIDKMPISADAKALLYDLADMAMEIGGRLISVGRQIIAFVLDLARRFPNTTFGAIISLAVSSLIASVPLLGPLLAPFLTPLLLAFGLTAGALADIRDAGIRTRISALERHFMTVVATR